MHQAYRPVVFMPRCGSQARGLPVEGTAPVRLLLLLHRAHEPFSSRFQPILLLSCAERKH
ncbi:protein of unknown function [Methylorubrum extorquens]|uniref:Uncharacterized protein n=1 Tax=Methylorubrum extorquens TaxID=408 RepID=A0A2N9AHR6_METEX|nr:protein of unknown function [Methylorubrum extorquens]